MNLRKYQPKTEIIVYGNENYPSEKSRRSVSNYTPIKTQINTPIK